MTGFLCLDKPKGITSFTAANLVRKICGIKKAGHTGTLDPMATGVLPVMLGGTTRFSEFLPTHDKEYRAKILLGTVTDTLDITGEIIEKKEVTATKEDFNNSLQKFTGEIEQTPPMYSALSKNGVKLYKLARRGVEVEREKRKVTIYSSQLISCNPLTGEYEITVSCSAGTYIRTLADDIGKTLGCGAVLTELRRTSANGFFEKDAVTLEELRLLAQEEKLDSVITKTDEMLYCFDKINISSAQSKRFFNGGNLDKNRIKGNLCDGIYRVYSDSNVFLGLGEIKPESDTLDIAKIFIDN